MTNQTRSTSCRMSPARYLSEIVLPTISDFESRPDDARLAMLACTVCYHVVDAISVSEGIVNEKAVYNRLVIECPELKSIKAVSLATKHLVVRQIGFAEFSIDDLKVDSAPAFSDGSYYSDGSSHSDAPPRAVLDSYNLRKIELLRDVKACARFFGDYVTI